MKNNAHIPHAGLKYHKALTYNHTLSLLAKANKSLFTDKIQLFNSSRQVAKKAILMLYLSIHPVKNDVEIIECNYSYDLHIYPNGIIQINFENLELQPNERIKFVLRIKTGDSVSKEHIIKNNYLFFCL
ncbi:MAG: hypothetical protein U9Q98_00845 [Bacteroidota bacterium]|nr:hypothetical protein [Bacteroidota bacterium]